MIDIVEIRMASHYSDIEESILRPLQQVGSTTEDSRRNQKYLYRWNYNKQYWHSNGKSSDYEKSDGKWLRWQQAKIAILPPKPEILIPYISGTMTDSVEIPCTTNNRLSTPAFQQISKCWQPKIAILAPKQLYFHIRCRSLSQLLGYTFTELAVVKNQICSWNFDQI